MEDPNLQYDPVDGWNDTSETVFKTNPSDVEVRPMFQRLFDQIKTFINTTLISWIKTTFATRLEIQGIVLGQIPDGTITVSKLDESLANDIKQTETLTINQLLMLLQLANSSINIDAWCDLLANDSMLDGGLSSGYTIESSKLKLFNKIVISPDSYSTVLGQTSSMALGQVFKFMSLGGENVNLRVVVPISKTGSPTDTITCELYSTSGGIPSSSLMVANNNVNGSALSTSYQDITFNFNTFSFQKNVEYAVVFKRSGSANASNYYNLRTCVNTAYAGYSYYRSDGSTWSAFSNDLNLVINFDGIDHKVIWHVTSTEVLQQIAVVANQTLNTGDIQWFVSDDGINWTEIENLQQMYTVDFSNNEVYLKCIITGDAEVDSVAWGGY
jgi:hypothetical protein